MRNSIEAKPEGTSRSAPPNQQEAARSESTEAAIVGLLSRADVGRRLGVCTHTVQRLTRRGMLPALVFNKRLIRYRPEVVEAFINSAAVGE